MGPCYWNSCLQPERGSSSLAYIHMRGEVGRMETDHSGTARDTGRSPRRAIISLCRLPVDTNKNSFGKRCHSLIQKIYIQCLLWAQHHCLSKAYRHRTGMNKNTSLRKEFEKLTHAPVPGNACGTASLVTFDFPTNGFAYILIVSRVSVLMFPVYWRGK